MIVRLICDESERIVLSASKLIAAQIRDMTCDMSKYPTSDNIQAQDSISGVARLLGALVQSFGGGPLGPLPLNALQFQTKKAVHKRCSMQHK